MTVHVCSRKLHVKLIEKRIVVLKYFLKRKKKEKKKVTFIAC